MEAVQFCASTPRAAPFICAARNRFRGDAMKAYVIKNALLGMALFAVTAAAQDQDSLQPPPAPQAPLAPQAPVAPVAPLAPLPQVRELNIAPFSSGTYLGVSL